MCSIVKAELFNGDRKSAKPSDNLVKVHRFVDRFHSFPFDDNASEKYSEIRSELEIAGTPIGPNDLLIASIELANNIILVTHNTSEFSRIRGLKIEDWE